MHISPYGTVRNLIDEESRVLNFGTGNWVADNGNELYRSTGVDYGRFATSSLGVRALEEFTAAAEIDNVQIPDELRRIPVRAAALVRVNKNAEARLILTVSGDGASQWISNGGDYRSIRAGEWILFSVLSEVTGVGPLQGNSVASLRVEVEWDESVDHPRDMFLLNSSISVPQEAFYNISAIESYMRIPEYLRQADSQLIEPDYPLYRFVEMANAVTHDIDDKWRKFRYLPPEQNDGVIKFSELVDPLLADLKTNVWLAQFVGVDLVDPRSGFTTWGSLVAASDINNDDESTWDEWGEAIGGDDSTLQWNEIEDFDVQTVSSEALLSFIRWQVSTAAYGLRGGTTASILVAVRQGLVDPNGPITILRHVDEDPFKVHILVSEANLKTDLPSLQALIDPAVPAGFEVTAFAPS